MHAAVPSDCFTRDDPSSPTGKRIDFETAEMPTNVLGQPIQPRSVDFDPFAQVFYPNETARPLILGLIQMLWDRGEPNGYAHRMTTDPLPTRRPTRCSTSPSAITR